MEYHIKILNGKFKGFYLLKPNINLMYDKLTLEEVKIYHENVELEALNIKKLGLKIVIVQDGKLIENES